LDRVKKQYDKGLITQEEKNIELNKIIQSILHLLQELELDN